MFARRSHLHIERGKRCREPGRRNDRNSPGGESIRARIDARTHRCRNRQRQGSGGPEAGQRPEDPWLPPRQGSPSRRGGGHRSEPASHRGHRGPDPQEAGRNPHRVQSRSGGHAHPREGRRYRRGGQCRGPGDPLARTRRHSELSGSHGRGRNARPLRVRSAGESRPDAPAVRQSRNRRATGRSRRLRVDRHQCGRRRRPGRRSHGHRASLRSGLRNDDRRN